MNTIKTWLITGAGRGLGVGHRQRRPSPPATRSSPPAATPRPSLHATRRSTTTCWSCALDITDPDQPLQRAVAGRRRTASAASTCWSTTPATSIAGFFEEISDRAGRGRRSRRNLFGPMNVTRAVLPVMRAQRAGHDRARSPRLAGMVGQEFCSAYAAAKFGVEGWMESLAFEVEPFGIRTTIVEPGFFRTDLLTTRVHDLGRAVDRRLRRADRRHEERVAGHERPAGRRPRQARRRAHLARSAPTRAPAALGRRSRRRRGRRGQGQDLLAQVDAYRELSSSLAHDDA